MHAAEDERGFVDIKHFAAAVQLIRRYRQCFHAIAHVMNNPVFLYSA